MSEDLKEKPEVVEGVQGEEKKAEVLSADIKEVEEVVNEAAAETLKQSSAPKTSKAKKATAKEDKEELKSEKQKKDKGTEADKEEKAETPAETAQSLLAPDNAVDGLKIRRAKGSKNISVGVCHISATFNNTKVIFSDLKGNVISWSSAGRCNFKGSRKSTAYAAQVVTTEAAKVAMGHGLREVAVEVKGPGMGRDSAMRTLQVLGLGVLSIKDVTPVPHNGCRPRKQRRV